MIFYSLLPISPKTFLKQQKNFFSSPIKLNSSNSRAFFRSFFPLLRLTKVEFSKTKQDKRKTKIIKNGYKLYARRVQFEKKYHIFLTLTVLLQINI